MTDEPKIVRVPAGRTIEGSGGQYVHEEVEFLVGGWSALMPPGPAKVVMHAREEDGTVTEVEEFDEWRLTGLDGGTNPYDFTGHAPEHINAVRAIWAKIQSGEYHWTEARLTRRHVTITRTPWTDAESTALGE